MSWEYEGLFDAIRDTEAEDMLGPYWRAQPTSVQAGRMGYRTRTVKAGPRLEAEIYPIFGREQHRRLRAARKNITPEKQARLNRERSLRHFIQLIDGNFGPGDVHVTLTYRDAPAYDRAVRDVQNFIRRVKRMRQKAGLGELKYAGVIEGDEDGTKRRIHAHLIMSGGIDREELERLWGRGYANADRLQPDENGLEAVARYILKQQRNRKKWFASRNLKQPSVRISDTKASNARVKRIAKGIQGEAKEVMEKMYPGYSLGRCQVYWSDVVDGVYIRCVMRKRENGR